MNTIAFIHGFAAHPSIWDEQIKDLSDKYLVRTNLDEKLENIFLVGWSLGGQAALKYYLSYPQKVRGIVLVSSFARYLKSEDYPCGIPYALFKKLEKKILTNQNEGVKYFYQLVSSEKQHPIFEKFPKPDLKEISRDLEKLRAEDLRSILPEIKIPALLIHGAKDQVVHFESSNYLKNKIPNAHLVVFDKSGHAPFLDETDKFNMVLEEFLLKHGT